MKKMLVPCLAMLIFAALPVSAQEGTPTITWKFQTEGEVWGAPSVDGGVVYVGSDDGRLYAVETETGAEIWHFQTGDKVRSRPALTETLVYVACDDGYLYAVNRADGTEAWRGDIGTEFVAMEIDLKVHKRTQWDYQQSSPTVADGVVYVGGNNKYLFAFDAATGTELWRFLVEDTIGRVWSSPAVADGMVYIGGEWGAFHAINAQTGEEIWNADLRLTVRPSPTVADGMVFIGSRNPALKAFDAKTGAEIWSFSYGVSWVKSTAVVVDGVLYIGSSVSEEAERYQRRDGRPDLGLSHARLSLVVACGGERRGLYWRYRVQCFQPALLRGGCVKR